MFALWLAVQVVHAPVILPQRPLVGTTATEIRPAVRKQKMIADGRALLARAERIQTGYAPAAGQTSKAELQNQIDRVKNELDSMSEMGEMESMRLQIAMDRMSRMMSTLSNLLKKISDTQDAIVQNIK